MKFNAQMTKIAFFIVFAFIASIAYTQALFSKSYGNPTQSAIIFIHGGPSGNATLFEATTAQKLADRGFYVIVYDRRGEGRSIDTSALFTYEEAFKDLHKIYESYKINKAHLVAHSFGGLVATLFTEKYPEKVHSLILVGALVSQQETYNHILKEVSQIYRNQRDTLMLAKVEEIKNRNKQSAEYRKGCFDLASENGFFQMPQPTIDAQKLRQEYEASEIYKSNIRNSLAPIKFYQNERQNNISTVKILKRLKAKKVKIYAMYGLQDKIFSPLQLKRLKRIVRQQNFLAIENCSHYLFVDQQEIFITTIEKWIK